MTRLGPVRSRHVGVPPDTKLLHLDGFQVVKVPVALRPPDVSDDDWQSLGRINDAIINRVRYDHDRVRNGSLQGVQSPSETLRRGLGICMDYAALFEATARRQRFDVKSLMSDSLNHAWNSVYVGGKWRLIDVTWNAGDIFESGGAVPDRIRIDHDFRRRFFLTTLEREAQMLDAGLTRQTHHAPDVREVDFSRTLQAMALIADLERLLAGGGDEGPTSGASAGDRRHPARFVVGIGETGAKVSELYDEYLQLEANYPLAIKFRVEIDSKH